MSANSSMYLTPEEVVARAAARRVTITLGTLSSRRATGRPPESRRIAGRVYYPADAVERWLDDGEAVGERLGES